MSRNICVLQPEEADEFRPDRHKPIPEQNFRLGASPDCRVHQHVNGREARRLTGFESFAAFRRATEGPLGRAVTRRIARLPAEWLDGRRIVMRSYAWERVQRTGSPGNLQLFRRGI